MLFVPDLACMFLMNLPGAVTKVKRNLAVIAELVLTVKKHLNKMVKQTLLSLKYNILQKNLDCSLIIN